MVLDGGNFWSPNVVVMMTVRRGRHRVPSAGQQDLPYHKRSRKCLDLRADSESFANLNPWSRVWVMIAAWAWVWARAGCGLLTDRLLASSMARLCGL